MNAEQLRLDASNQRAAHWKRWGPYLSERAWGTVREDYSADGTAWDYFPHDHARSRAYRWNEDGLAGICDRHQSICFALALWNGQDPILKERAVRPDRQRRQPRRGRQGVLLLSRQHADALLHEVPVQVSAARRSRTTSSSTRTAAAARSEPEYELLDTGVFDDDRYFDVFVEYAKADSGRHPVPDHRRESRRPSRRRSTCCRRSGSATPGPGDVTTDTRRRACAAARPSRAPSRSSCRTAMLGARTLTAEGQPAAAVHRERDEQRSGCSARRRARRYVKDGINDYVVHGRPTR